MVLVVLGMATLLSFSLTQILRNHRGHVNRLKTVAWPTNEFTIAPGTGKAVPVSCRKPVRNLAIVAREGSPPPDVCFTSHKDRPSR